MKLDWKAAVGVLITVVLLWYVFQDVDFREVWAEVRTAHWGYLLAAVFVATSGFLVRALRWKVLLAPVKSDTSLRSRYAAVNIGFMANNILPARVGEFARAYALSRMEPVPVSAAFGSLVVERLLDGVVLISFLLLAVAAPSFPANASLREGPVGAALQGMVVVLVVGIVLMFALIRWPGPFVRFLERIAVRLPGDFARPLVDAMEAFLDALAILRRPSLLVQAFLWSVAFWTWHGLSFWLGMKAFAIELNFVAAIFVEAVVGFGVAVPSAPGFFGTFHAAADWALSDVYGVAPARSLAFAFGYHLGGFVPVTLIGMWYAWRMGLSLKEVERSESRVEKAVERGHPEAAALLGDKGADWRGKAPPPGWAAAPAKVNLGLAVGPRGPDGYHDLETLFQALDLHDVLHVAKGPAGVRLELTGRPVPGDADDNLVARAARAYAEAAGMEPAWTIRLEKRIPAGAGLGGGSSDAAATLRALDRLEGGRVGEDRLRALGGELGADVPFFLGSSPLASGRGRGDRIEPLRPLPGAEVVVCLPDAHVSTAEAYAALDAHRAGSAIEGPSGGAPVAFSGGPSSWSAVAADAGNDFETVVPGEHPAVAEALAALRRTGPVVALLAGSGGACFALYGDAAAADRAVAMLGRDLPALEVVRARTLEAWPGDEGSGRRA